MVFRQQYVKTLSRFRSVFLAFFQNIDNKKIQNKYNIIIDKTYERPTYKVPSFIIRMIEMIIEEFNDINDLLMKSNCFLYDEEIDTIFSVCEDLFKQKNVTNLKAIWAIGYLEISLIKIKARIRYLEVNFGNDNTKTEELKILKASYNDFQTSLISHHKYLLNKERSSAIDSLPKLKVDKVKNSIYNLDMKINKRKKEFDYITRLHQEFESKNQPVEDTKENDDNDDIKKGICVIYANDKKSKGTGWYIGEKTIITCAHVINDNHDIIADFINLGSGTSYNTTIRYMDKNKDIAILKIIGDDSALRAYKLSIEDNKILQAGDKVFTYGYLLKLGYSGIIYQSGNISDKNLDNTFYLTSVPIYYGFSGCPLIDQESKKVVGMFKGVLSGEVRMKDYDPATGIITSEERRIQDFKELSRAITTKTIKSVLENIKK